MAFFFFFFKQKTAYEMRISDWSSDVCSSDLLGFTAGLPEYAANIVLLKSADVVGVSWGETVGRVPGLFAQHMSALFGLIEGGRLVPPAPRVLPIEQAADRIPAMANRPAVGKTVAASGPRRCAVWLPVATPRAPPRTRARVKPR